MLAAIGWGALAASSLVIGALLGLAHRWPDRAVGLVLAFGAERSSARSPSSSPRKACTRARRVGWRWASRSARLTYFALDRRLDRRGRRGGGAGTALALGAFLDGIPEQLALGIGLAGGLGVGVGLLVAIFVSNLPEAIGSSTDMRRAGRSPRTVLRLWLAVAAVCALSTLVGYAIADGVGGAVKGAVNGFAAGALLVMLVDSMAPEAAAKGGRTAGLATALGFAVAAGLSGLS
jgi:ZIP family zinc transporter